MAAVQYTEYSGQNTQTVHRLTPDGSSTVHRIQWTEHTNSTQVDTRWQQYSTHLNTVHKIQWTEHITNTRGGGKNWEVILEVRAMPRLCELYPGICLTTKEKAWINLS
jgi:hypothetical protein